MLIECSGAEAKVAALELPGGALIKVDPQATPTQFLQAASACNGQAAAAALLGQVVAAGGISRAPLILLATHAEVVHLYYTVMLSRAHRNGAALKCMCLRFSAFLPSKSLLPLPLLPLSPRPVSPPLVVSTAYLAMATKRLL